MELAEEQRAELERRAMAHTSSWREARRARAILLCAEGVPLCRIGPTVGLNEHQVTLWRRRFVADRLDGLVDRPRSGRPPPSRSRRRPSHLAMSDARMSSHACGMVSLKLLSATGLRGDGAANILDREADGGGFVDHVAGHVWV